MQKNYSRKYAGGFGLIEVMIALAIMSISMMGFLQMMATQHQASSFTQSVSTRNLMQTQIERYIVDPNALTQTMADVADAGNVALNNCYNAVGASCVEALNVPFYMLDAQNVKITGIDTAPIRYDINGSICAGPASPNCMFEVFTSYESRCPGASPCGSPSVLTVTYTIRQAPGLTTAGVTPLKVVSKTVTINPVVGGFTQNDVTATRGYSTGPGVNVYQNTTGKPMFVSVVVWASVNRENFSFFTDMNPNPVTLVAGGELFQDTSSYGFYVVPNAYYKATHNAGEPLRRWIEWY